MQIAYNPYAEVDWQDVVRVNAISHEHIFRQDQLQNAYDRGIRYFACVNYRPSMPSYPLSSWNYIYRDYVSLEDLTIEDKVYSGSIPTVNDVDTDTLPQIPNAEHPQFTDFNGQHFNVLGSIFPDPGNGTFGTPAWRAQHPFFSMKNVFSLFSPSSVSPFGKLFGTINHCQTYSAAFDAYSWGGGIFKGFEVFNQGYTREVRENFVKTYDKLLMVGLRLFPLAVVDWQGDIESYGLPGQDMDSYVKTVDFDRGCNVLLMPSSYNSIPANDFTHSGITTKAFTGLDAYIAGRFYASGLGQHYIECLNAYSGVVKITFDSSPSNLVAIVDGKRYNLPARRELTFNVPVGSLYVRFEASWSDYDFIYTSPIWYVKENDVAKKYIALRP